MPDIFSDIQSDIQSRDPFAFSLQEQLQDVSGKETEELPKDDTPKDHTDFFSDIKEFIKDKLPFVDSEREISEKRDEEFKDFLFNWSDSGYGNCFAFASGFFKDPTTGKNFDHKPAPGDISGQWDGDYMPYFDDLVYETDENGVRQTLEYYWAKDCARSDKELERAPSGDYQPKEGERLVAMMYSDRPYAEDFHFMVKGQYGTWYHKPGLMAPKRTDESGEIITDPATCNRGIYDHFCGYYIVRDKV